MSASQICVAIPSDTNEIILEHKTWVEELKMEKEYQLCLKEMNYEEKLKELTEKFNQQMDSITKQNQVLNSEKDKQKRLKAITGRAAKELQDLESLELQLRLQRIKKNYEKKMQKLKDGHARALEDIMQVKLKEKELELGHVRNGPAHRTAPDHTHIAV